MSTLRKWVILKPIRGQYLNSPVAWQNVGMIEDDSVESAVIRACFITGSSQIGLVPEHEFHIPEE